VEYSTVASGCQMVELVGFSGQYSAYPNPFVLGQYRRMTEGNRAQNTALTTIRISGKSWGSRRVYRDGHIATGIY
jgi:hypothetical protein